MTTNLTSNTFKMKIFDYEKENNWKFKGDKPCVIKFGADWCAPCRTIDPILDELSDEYEGKVDVYKINTENERELASAFGIRSIPSILFIPMDGQPQMAQGALPKETFVKAFDEVLSL